MLCRIQGGHQISAQRLVLLQGERTHSDEFNDGIGDKAVIEHIQITGIDRHRIFEETALDFLPVGQLPQQSVHVACHPLIIIQKSSASPTASAVMSRRVCRAMMAPGSASLVDHRRGGVVRAGLINHRRGDGHEAEWIDDDMNVCACGRGGPKRESGEGCRENSLFHELLLVLVRALREHIVGQLFLIVRHGCIQRRKSRGELLDAVSMRLGDIAVGI